MPDDTLDETFASADRIEVDLGGRGVESHGVSCVDELIIVPKGAESGSEWTVVQPSTSSRIWATMALKLSATSDIADRAYPVA